MIKPTKRPWYMFYPLAGLILLCFAWSGYWYVAYVKTREIITIQRRELAAQGLQLKCGDESWGGFPFRFEFRCAGMALSYKGAVLKTGSVLAVAQAYNPLHILLLVNGPTSIARNDSSLATVTHDDALISITLNTTGEWDVSSDVAHINVPQFFSTASLRLFARKKTGRIDFAGNSDGLDLVGPNNLQTPIDHAEFLAQTSDGEILDVTAFRVSSGRVDFNSQGKIALDANHFLTGSLSTQTNDIDGLLKLISPLLEMSEKDQAAIKSLLATQGNIPNSPSQKADFVARNGGLYWGPFKLMDIKPVY
jgi:Uncharacterized protein conserved in bacteria (DUF2125)